MRGDPRTLFIRTRSSNQNVYVVNEQQQKMNRNPGMTVKNEMIFIA